MSAPSFAVAAASPALSLFPVQSDPAACLIQAARLLLPRLARGQAIDAPALRAAMQEAFGHSDAEGGWSWKLAYDACEAAQVLFLQKYGAAMWAGAREPAARLAMLAKLAGLIPTHTRRSEESQALQQFSTPLALGFAASVAAALSPGDVVLEPSAGTGCLPSSPRARAPRSCSTSWPRRVPAFWVRSFPA